MKRRARPAVQTALIAIVLLCTASAGATDFTDVYSDPAGDVSAGWTKIVPDITQVTLTTSADGTLAFDVHLARSVDLLGGPPGEGLSTLSVDIDSDKNPATGGPSGDFVAYQIGPSRFNVRRWNGSAYADFPHQPPANHWSGTDLTFTLNLHDLGVTTFDFSVIGANLGQGDNAPNTGEYSYPPAITSLVVPDSLLRPKAGHAYRISGVTARLSNDAIAVPDSLGCALTYRAKPLHPLAGGCAWRIPRRYRRKVMRLTLTAIYRGSSATVSFAVRPR